MLIPKKANVVIIGGGIIGCSVAYHLGKLGWKDIVLLERKQLTCGTTWHAAGLIAQLRATKNMTRLAKYSQELYQKLEDEGRILSQAIGRSIAIADNYRAQIIMTREAQTTIVHLLEKSRVRIRLFSYQGDLLADSKRTIGFRTKIKETQLPDVKKKNFFRINFSKKSYYYRAIQFQ